MRIKQCPAIAFLSLLVCSTIFASATLAKDLAAEPVYKALNPRGFMSEVQLHPLAQRVPDLNDKVVYLLTQKAEGSGMETVFATVKEELLKRYPKVKIVFKYKPSAYMTDDPDLWAEMRKNGQAFIYGAAPSASTTHWVSTWAAGLEKKGLPGSVIVYDTCAETAKTTAVAQGVPLRFTTISYPFQNMTSTQKAEVMDKVVKGITQHLSQEKQKTSKYTPPRPDRIATQGTTAQIQEYFEKQGWTDGLPIIAPTEEKVAAMLKGTRQTPDEVVARTIWPEKWQATVEKVAINGVMAGCKPEYLPVLLACAEAWSKGDYASSVRSTNSFSYMQVVNGPVRNEIRMSSGVYALGPGNHANATIGRALRLFIINLGGGEVGINILGTQGNPSAYTFCFAENEESSPWEPFSVTQGFKKGESTVTIFSGGWCHAGNYLAGDIQRMAYAMRGFEFPNGIVALLSPQAAKLQAQAGKSKKDVEDFIWKNATLPLREFRKDTYYSWFIEPILKGKEMYGQKYVWPKEYLTLPEDTEVPVYPRIYTNVIVVGGETNPMMQGWKMAYPSTVSVDKWR